MKSTQTRLAVLGAVAVVVALLASAAAFNLFAGWKVEADATSDLNYALYLSDEEGTGRTPNAFYVNESYELIEDEYQLNSSEERLLATWFAQHPTQDVIQPVMLNGGACYAAIVSAEELLERRLWKRAHLPSTRTTRRARTPPSSSTGTALCTSTPRRISRSSAR